MKAKRISEVRNMLNNLNKKDVYSLLLFVLYKLKDDPKFITLTELSYILDENELIKFLSYYEGMTLTIPTLKDYRLVITALKLYELVNFEEVDFGEALKVIQSGSEFSKEAIVEVYNKLSDSVNDYDFTRAEEEEVNE